MATKVLAVFNSGGDGDGYTVFDLVAITTTKEAAIKAIEADSGSGSPEIHWCKRDDLDSQCRYGGTLGHVVEEIEVLE